MNPVFIDGSARVSTDRRRSREGSRIQDPAGFRARRVTHPVAMAPPFVLDRIELKVMTFDTSLSLPTSR